MALAGFAWTLSLVTNYAETGEIRQRGDFAGRRLVQASAPAEGSVVVELAALLSSNPVQIFGSVVAGVGAGSLLVSLMDRVISRNVGTSSPEADRVLANLLSRRGGDVEALVAIAEAPIRQSHSVIGNGAERMEISGGFNIINSFNEETKEYVSLNVSDNTVMKKKFSVSAFNANSGYGSVFDRDIGRVVPFSMKRDALDEYKGDLSWGLDQYATGQKGRLILTFTRILSMDGTPKRYIIRHATRSIS